MRKYYIVTNFVLFVIKHHKIYKVLRTFKMYRKVSASH